ncbi:MAG: fructose-1,6-bisphosphatase [Lachnospiraceae bacterium]|nr:fructose-1,6-bisphosphatase [Lachnospiraceae bacterium]
MESKEEILKLLKEKYPTRQAVTREIINLNAILNLPKGTEHFMSDLHGEYAAFLHILNNCSGVIREKIDVLFEGALSDAERQELCTLIYYPQNRLTILKEQQGLTSEWYIHTLNNLIEIAKMLSSKYTRSKVRKAMPEDFAYIIDELIHAQKDEDDNQVRYHAKIIDSIIETDSAEEFIIALASLIKKLAVDHLHIVGDIFDRGGSADKILDLLMTHHSIDIQWGNHDILWMGAVCGSEACIAGVLRNNLKYGNTQILENAYGISLRRLMFFAMENYHDSDPVMAAYRAISVMLFKLEGQIIMRHPEYGMTDRTMLDKVDADAKTVTIAGKAYKLKDAEFPTLDASDPFRLTDEEDAIIRELKNEFKNSIRLKSHIDFLYEVGGMYRIHNGNLLYHGCVPMDENGNFSVISVEGEKLCGKAFYDRAEAIVRRAYYDGRIRDDLDFMWFLWGAELSPLCGRRLKTFERMYIEDETTWEEPSNPYYRLYFNESICERILRDFSLFNPDAHIINGHTPVCAIEGESPVRAGGKLLVIDGGFCKAMNQKTGTAGYTLIYNSHGLRLKAHHPFTSVEEALLANADIESDSKLVEVAPKRILVSDADNGKAIMEDIRYLNMLLEYYKKGGS